MLNPDLIAQLWPVHVIIWLICLLGGAAVGWFMANQTETRWAAALIQLAIVVNLPIGLLPVISGLSLMSGLPDVSSGSRILELYLSVTSWDWFLKGAAHVELVLQSTGIAVVAWIASAMLVMFWRWEDPY